MSSTALDPMATPAAATPVLNLAEFGLGLVAESPLFKLRNQVVKRLFDLGRFCFIDHHHSHRRGDRARGRA